MHSNQPYILGISAYFHDSAAALVHGSTIVAAAQEERFSRVKADWKFPQQAIDYCLSQLPAGTELDAVAFYEDPSIKIERILRCAVANAPRGAQIWPKTLNALKSLNSCLPDKLMQILPDADRIYFSPHHRSHAASAFYPSPFEDAAILVADGVGEWASTSVWHGTSAGICQVNETRFPHSLGLLYSAFTQYCGFKVNSGEYKLMGLAPFGKPIFKKLIYKNLIEVRTDGSFQLNLEYFDFEAGTGTINPLFRQLFSYPQRGPHDTISMHYMNVAASIQCVLNEIMIKQAETALKLTKSKNLCMAGGVALNCVTNSELARNVAGLEGIWVQPAAGDAGGALGAALDISHDLKQFSARRRKSETNGMQFAQLGPEFSHANIKATIDHYDLVYEDYSHDEAGLITATADALEGGDIVGYFDGRMEFGPRALGNRSILADPRPANMLQRANKKIKFRETWRPLAPIVLAEHEDQLFDSSVSDPYMLFVSTLKKEFRIHPDLKELRSRGLSELKQYLKKATSKFPTVVHYDYSARTQSLSNDANPRLHSILARFYQQTGCPMLLNTSFNVRGEPIVCNPEDAVKTFLNTHLDVLVIGRIIVRRKSQSRKISAMIGKRQFHED